MFCFKSYFVYFLISPLFFHFSALASDSNQEDLSSFSSSRTMGAPRNSWDSFPRTNEERRAAYSLRNKTSNEILHSDDPSSDEHLEPETDPTEHGQYTKFLRLCSRALKAHESKDPKSVIKYGKMAIREHLEQSLKCLSRALQKNPNTHWSVYRRAVCLALRLEDYHSAWKYSKALLQNKKDNNIPITWKDYKCAEMAALELSIWMASHSYHPSLSPYLDEQSLKFYEKALKIDSLAHYPASLIPLSSIVSSDRSIQEGLSGNIVNVKTPCSPPFLYEIIALAALDEGNLRMSFKYFRIAFRNNPEDFQDIRREIKKRVSQLEPNKETENFLRWLKTTQKGSKRARKS